MAELAWHHLGVDWVAVGLPEDPRLRTLSVRPHDLADHDRLDNKSHFGDEEKHHDDGNGPHTDERPDSVRQRLRHVGLYGLPLPDDAVLTKPWIERAITCSQPLTNCPRNSESA